MRSTFMGLEASKRGLFTQQAALHTTGHNISNANTDGYSRQRVTMQATAGYPGTGLNAPKIPGHLGTGVEASTVERMRDDFSDRQFRQESNKLGYWQSRSQAISQLEDVMNEPSEYGLAKSMDDFWKSLQDLSVNPENSGARAVVVQRGVAVAESFNYISKSISTLKADYSNELDVAAKDISSILESIAGLNRQIQEVEPNGYLPNDLYDARDVLIDKLSAYLPVDVTPIPSGGGASSIAEGGVRITLKTKDGAAVELVNGQDWKTFEVNRSADDNATGVSIGEEAVPVDALLHSGKVMSLIYSYGYTAADSNKGIYNEALANLNELAEVFSGAFNAKHAEGTDLNGVTGIGDFFEQGNSAADIQVNDDLLGDPDLLAASDSAPGSAEVGNGNNARNLADVMSTTMDFNGKEATPKTFYQSLIGKLGVDGQQASRMAHNAETLQLAVDARRASASSVSLDEEMTNMITFQQAYNANARMITVVDEMLDKIVNGMGTGGR